MKSQVDNKQDKTTDKSPLCDKVLGRISDEHIAPCPRWQFRLREYGVWVLWGLSVVAGAVAVAVMWYVANNARFAMHEATHDTALSFFVEVLPYIWILLFVLMAGLAYVNMRHTKHGYKYPFGQVIGSSLFFAVVGGMLLNFAGVGQLIDTSLGHSMPTYPSMEKKEMQMWQMPNEGRLVGSFDQVKDGDMQYEVKDVKGNVWHVTVVELSDFDQGLLLSGNLVRILGTTTDPKARNFHACGVFPWMFDKRNRGYTLVAEREHFVRRMYDHMETGDRLHSLEKETFDEKTYGKPFMEGLCAEIAAVKRMSF